MGLYNSKVKDKKVQTYSKFKVSLDELFLFIGNV